MHTHWGRRYESSVKRFPLFLFCFSGRNLFGNIIFRTPTQILVVPSPSACHYTLHVDTPPSSMPPSRCTWSRFLLACHSRNLRGISAKNTCVLFTLWSRCISNYFCSQCPTSAAASTYQKSLQVIIEQNHIKNFQEDFLSSIQGCSR